jgi:uncharacterized membrane protein HdeD (DUF308 family)
MSDLTGPAANRVAGTRMLASFWWVFALRGMAALLFGILAFVAPKASLALILAILAAWLAIDGVATLAQAISCPKERRRLGFWIDGILSLAAAAALLMLPLVSAVALVILVGAWAIVAGVARLVLAFRTGIVLLGAFGALTVVLGAWLLVAPGPGLLALIWVVGLRATAAGFVLLVLAWRLRRARNAQAAA